MPPIRPALSIAIALALISLIAYLDYVTGVEIAMSIFYLVPVGLVSWGVGFRVGVIFSVLGGLLWFSMDRAVGLKYSTEWIGVWNAFMRTMIFLVTARLLSSLRKTLSRAVEAQCIAESATKAKSIFLANISHEIRTPMNAVLAMAELLSESPLNAEQQNYVHLFKREGRRLMQLINDLLDLSKIESSVFSAEQNSFRLRKMIAEVTSIASVPIREKGIRFDYTVSPDVPDEIVGDPTLLKRILHNLLNNATKFTLEGSIQLTVEQGSGKNDGKLYFLVSDTGIGIHAEKLEVVFESFKQEDESISNRFGGTGLGLSLCRTMAEKMGGQIVVESEKGVGSRFQFYIPLRLGSPGSADSTDLPDTKPIDSACPADSRPLLLLLADDYDVNRQIIRAFLKNTPYEIEEAHNGAIAVECFKNKAYDLVLMDISMPVMDGHQACRAMREWEKLNQAPRTPIVALTAHAYEEDIRKSLNSGCDAHLSKPVEKALLIQTILKLTKNRVGLSKQNPPQSIPSHLNECLLEQLRPKFIEDARKTCGVILEAIENKTPHTAQRAGHNLKGSAILFGLFEIGEIGGKVEAAAAQGDFTLLNTLRLQLESAVDQVENIHPRR